MNRRNFIKVMGTGAVVLAASPLLLDQVNGEKSESFRPEHTYDDIRKTLLSYAMLCPNAHNKQPWKVTLHGQNEIMLFVDSERLLPETDPIHRQIHISQGTFIESLVIAATHFGIKADVDYFPEGEYDNQSIAALPVASIKLIKQPDIQTDPLFTQLLSRQSNKTPYTDEKVPKSDREKLEKLVEDTPFLLQIVDEPSDKKNMADFVIKAMEIEEKERARNMETIAMFRFNDEEFAQHRDGFGLPQNGVVGVKRMVAEAFFLSRAQTEKDPSSFGKEGVKLTQNVANSTQHFALLSSQDNSRKTQIEIGRLYNRLNLTTSALGIAQHPMSQILQEYEDMLPLQAEFKKHYHVQNHETVQMLFRLGKAKATPLSPRREVQDLLG